MTKVYKIDILYSVDDIHNNKEQILEDYHDIRAFPVFSQRWRAMRYLQETNQSEYDAIKADQTEDDVDLTANLVFTKTHDGPFIIVYEAEMTCTGETYRVYEMELDNEGN